MTKIQFTLYNLEVSVVYDDDWNVFNILPVMKSSTRAAMIWF